MGLGGHLLCPSRGLGGWVVGSAEKHRVLTAVPGRHRIGRRGCVVRPNMGLQKNQTASDFITQPGSAISLKIRVPA